MAAEVFDASISSELCPVDITAVSEEDADSVPFVAVDGDTHVGVEVAVRRRVPG